MKSQLPHWQPNPRLRMACDHCHHRATPLFIAHRENTRTHHIDRVWVCEDCRRLLDHARPAPPDRAQP